MATIPTTSYFDHLTSSPNSQASLHLLAEYLAANYANVSLARINPDHSEYARYKSEFEIMLSRVFQSGLQPSSMRFTRNVLIVGAGASQQAFRFFKDGTGTIQEVEDTLKLSERLEGERGKHFRELYELHAQTVLHSTFRSGIDIALLQRKLGFEGRLYVLEQLYPPKRVREALNNVVYYRHFPNRTYEMMAHMFKHRFIDVVVNLNFDELLDNSIDDEVGDGTILKITPNSVAFDGEDLFTHNRLRNPVYIKPHGTASQFASMAYTDAQYIQMNDSMKQMLLKVFRGASGESVADHTPIINIMVVGYAFLDIDLRSILFEAIKDNPGEFNLFFWSRDAKPRFANLGKAYAEYRTDLEWNADMKKADVDAARVKWTADWDKRVQLREIKYVEEDRNQFDMDFVDLYRCINDKFSIPFALGNPSRHILLTDLFTKRYIETLHTNLQARRGKPEELRHQLATFYHHRVLYHVVYDFFKHNGTVPFSVLQGERAGSYYEKYLENQLGEKRYLAQSLEQIAADAIKQFEYDAHYCGVVIVDEAHRNELATLAADKLVTAMHSFASYDNPQELKDNLVDAFKKLHLHRHSEITPKLFDNKYGRFKAFDHAQVIFTNLHLTYLFYCMFKDPERRDKWNRLLFSSDTGRAMYNLYQHATTPDADLLQLVNEPSRTFQLLVKDGIPQGQKQHHNGSSINACITHHLGQAQVQIHKPRPGVPHMHHMALFLQDEDPVLGIYLMKPTTRNRINPIFFDLTGNSMLLPEVVHKVKSTTHRMSPIEESTRKNLSIMKSLFFQEY